MTTTRARLMLTASLAVALRCPRTLRFTVRYRSSWARAFRWLRPTVTAFCTGRVVHVAAFQANQWVLGHEAMHVVQRARYGFLGYWWLLAWNYLRRGYAGSRLEVEAREWAYEIADRLSWEEPADPVVGPNAWQWALASVLSVVGVVALLLWLLACEPATAPRQPAFALAGDWRLAAFWGVDQVAGDTLTEADLLPCHEPARFNLVGAADTATFQLEACLVFRPRAGEAWPRFLVISTCFDAGDAASCLPVLLRGLYAADEWGADTLDVQLFPPWWFASNGRGGRGTWRLRSATELAIEVPHVPAIITLRRR